MEEHYDWHAAFYDAIQAELVQHLSALTFEREHYLNTQPLRMDLLIIKKLPGEKIEKNFAEDFRGYNIVEYKSPSDSLSFSDYIKVLSYAGLYQAVEDIAIDDITVTIVCTRRPVVVLKRLNTSTGVQVTKRSAGIYKIAGEHFPVQIVVGKELPEDENLFLRSLKRGLTEPEALRLGDESRRIGLQTNLKALLYVLVKANQILYDREMYPMAATKWDTLFMELGWVDTWKAEGQAIGEAIGEARGESIGRNNALVIWRGIRQNVPPEQLAEETGWSVEEVEELRREFLSV